MKKLFNKIILLFVLSVMFLVFANISAEKSSKVLPAKEEPAYWLLLHRKSNIEYLYRGEAGKIVNSKLVKTFKVKTGVPEERPTPLPQLLDKRYWLITKKHEELENPETAPYFLTLNIPVPEEEPFGPAPYLECGGLQCNWTVPGAFGLHGINGDPSRLFEENLGSSGCIRHSDEDITYLYNLLDPSSEKVRYYVEDR